MWCIWEDDEKEYRIEEWEWDNEWWREWDREREIWNEYEKLWKWNEYKEIKKWDIKWKYNEWSEREYDYNKSKKEMINEYND